MEDKTYYLNDRIYSVRNAKKRDMEKEFHLIDDSSPQTFEELVKRIKDGKFITPEKTFLRRGYGPLDGIRWRDPSVEADQDGYDVAVKALDKEYQKVKDIIMVKSADDGLTALNEFEAWTYNKKNTKH